MEVARVAATVGWAVRVEQAARARVAAGMDAAEDCTVAAVASVAQVDPDMAAVERQVAERVGMEAAKVVQEVTVKVEVARAEVAVAAANEAVTAEAKALGTRSPRNLFPGHRGFPGSEGHHHRTHCSMPANTSRHQQ